MSRKLFDVHVVGVLGRGFSPADAPSCVVSLVSVGKLSSLNREGRSDVTTKPARRETVGDVYWELERSVPWTESQEQEIRVRIANVGMVKLKDMDKWTIVGDPGESLQVKLVVKQVASKFAEKERHERHLRIQRRQLELAMMRQVPADKLLQWEAKRSDRSAKRIQRSWRDFRKKSGQRTTSTAKPKRTVKKSFEGADEEDFRFDHRSDHDDVDFEEEGDDDSTKEKKEDDEEMEGEESEEDFKRLQELHDELSRVAFSRLDDSERYSTHEKYQYLIQQNKDMQEQWALFQHQAYFINEKDRKRKASLRKVDHLMGKLDHLDRSLNSYFEIGDGDQLTEKIQETKRYWPISGKKSISEQARNQHIAALKNMQVGKQWWSVRLGNEERDIRKLKAVKPPWKFGESTEEVLDDEEARELSRWWIAFSSGNPASVDAIMDSSRDGESHHELVMDHIRRDIERLVKETEERQKSIESPLLVTALSCPTHRLHRLRELIRGNLNNEVRSPRSNTSPRRSRSPSPRASPRSFIGTVDEQQQQLVHVQDDAMKQAKRGKRKKKGTKKKEKAMQMHIDSLEEQVAILRAQIAQNQLENLRNESNYNSNNGSE